MSRAALLLLAAGGLLVIDRAARASTGQGVAELVADEFTPDISADPMPEVTAARWTPPARAAQYLPAIAAAEDKYGIPRNLLARLIHQESRFRADIISGKTRSPAGAIGIAQFMPATAAEYGVDPLDPWQSIDGAGRYLARLFRRFGNWREALAAYNWGQGNVARKGLASAPAETVNYFTQIMGDLGLTA